MLQVIRPIERLTILALGRSVNDWIQCHYNFEGYNFGEIWTINAGWLFRHDVLWDMHTPEYIDALPENEAHKIRVRRDQLVNHDKPIIMARAVATHPTSVTFPLGEVVDLTQSNYFLNGMAYMLATALCCKVKRLSLFGVDMLGPEHALGRACILYWLGRLIESGCQVGPSSTTDLIDALRRGSGSIYGYHEPITFEYGGVEPRFAGPDYRGE